MAQNSILQCQNTEARNREGAQLHRRCSRKKHDMFETDEHLRAKSVLASVVEADGSLDDET
jgi:hypothetical protein